MKVQAPQCRQNAANKKQHSPVPENAWNELRWSIDQVSGHSLGGGLAHLALQMQSDQTSEPFVTSMWAEFK